MKLTAVGIDIAKNVFQAPHVNEETEEIVSKAIKRAKFLVYFANRAPCLIGMEACGGAHHWARQIMALRHKVRLMSARFVKAFNVRNKNDAAVQAISEIPGVGLLTLTEAVATMGEAKAFRSGREFAAWIGLVPQQTGTGGKAHLHGISKRSDTYLRTLLIHGTNSVLTHAKEAVA
jgi:transposase